MAFGEDGVTLTALALIGRDEADRAVAIAAVCSAFMAAVSGTAAKRSLDDHWVLSVKLHRRAISDT